MGIPQDLLLASVKTAIGGNNETVRGYWFFH
jgi:hypothetical protein